MAIEDRRFFALKQKLLSLTGEVKILDPNTQEPIGYFESKMITLGAKYWLREMNGEPILHVRQKLMKLMATYNFHDIDGNEDEGRHIGELKKKISLKPKYVFTEPDGRELFVVQGKITRLRYKITQDGQTIATISDKLLKIRKTYGVQINENAPNNLVPVILGIVVILHFEKMRSSGRRR